MLQWVIRHTVVWSLLTLVCLRIAKAKSSDETRLVTYHVDTLKVAEQLRLYSDVLSLSQCQELYDALRAAPWGFTGTQFKSGVDSTSVHKQNGAPTVKGMPLSHDVVAKARPLISKAVQLAEKEFDEAVMFDHGTALLLTRMQRTSLHQDIEVRADRNHLFSFLYYPHSLEVAALDAPGFVGGETHFYAENITGNGRKTHVLTNLPIRNTAILYPSSLWHMATGPPVTGPEQARITISLRLRLIRLPLARAAAERFKAAALLLTECESQGDLICLNMRSRPGYVPMGVVILQWVSYIVACIQLTLQSFSKQGIDNHDARSFATSLENCTEALRVSRDDAILDTQGLNTTTSLSLHLAVDNSLEVIRRIFAWLGQRLLSDVSLGQTRLFNFQGMHRLLPIPPATVALANDDQMPIVGFGTSKLHGSMLRSLVTQAIVAGVRLFDTAEMYGNELTLGRALKESNISRSELFIVSKSNTEDPLLALRGSLRRLGMNYLDLFLLHHVPQDLEQFKTQWRFMEKAHGIGLVRHIGISNINPEQLSHLISIAVVLPSVVQTIFSPIHRGLAASGGSQLLALCKRHRIVLQGFRVLDTYAGVGDVSGLVHDPIVQRAAEFARLSGPQVLLRWVMHRGVSTLFGTRKPARIKENVAARIDGRYTELVDRLLSSFGDMHDVWEAT